MRPTDPLVRDFVIAIVAVAAAALTALAPAQAQPSSTTAPATRSDAEPDKAGACELRVATGPAGKGFSRLFADMARVCSPRVRLCEVRSEGGLSNLTHLAANEAD